MAFLLPRSVFIHIPKTGGQWVIAALENAGIPVGRLSVVHASPDEIAHEPAFQERLVVFAMVRHPLSWYQSIWVHRMDEGWEPINDPDWFTLRWIETWAGFTQHCRATTFSEFVHKCVAQYPKGYVSMLYDIYTHGCTFVGRQERLAEDLLSALELAGEQFQPALIRGTQPRHVRARHPDRLSQCKYTSELVDIVMKTEARAIAKFGYEEISESIL